MSESFRPPFYSDAEILHLFEQSELFHIWPNSPVRTFPLSSSALQNSVAGDHVAAQQHLPPSPASQSLPLVVLRGAGKNSAVVFATSGSFFFLLFVSGPGRGSLFLLSTVSFTPVSARDAYASLLLSMSFSFKLLPFVSDIFPRRGCNLSRFASLESLFLTSPLSEALAESAFFLPRLFCYLFFFFAPLGLTCTCSRCFRHKIPHSGFYVSRLQTALRISSLIE